MRRATNGGSNPRTATFKCRKNDQEKRNNCSVSLKTNFTMAPWDISSVGIRIPKFNGTRHITNNFVEKIICVRYFATQFVEKIIYVGQLNGLIDEDDFQIPDPVKLM